MMKQPIAAGRATRTKSTFRMEYAVTTHIQGSPESIWALLTNAAEFPRWNSTVRHIEGEIALGKTIKLQATIVPERTFKLTVSEFIPYEKMVWRDGTPPIFTGVRTFTLTPTAVASTDFTMVEVFSGLMLPFIAGSLPDFRPMFEQYAADLKQVVEQAS